MTRTEYITTVQGINQPLQIILSVAQNCIREIQRGRIDTEGILRGLERIVTNVERIEKITIALTCIGMEERRRG